MVGVGVERALNGPLGTREESAEPQEGDSDLPRPDEMVRRPTDFC